MQTLAFGPRGPNLNRRLNLTQQKQSLPMHIITKSPYSNKLKFQWGAFS